ncbi:Vacuolar protein [Ceratobasidium theobromae]|uniref:5-formyltetrahydrofolate cyclo-ligase n=1 Tax=Ceratobasidium theobromae TaxID=1582974 RepID=A0A5N5QBR0_9AGAM|nr:Vacuolar protein [Ceratobasidium theobromae]
MKRIAEGKDVDLLLVDSGDLHDGSGLTDGYPVPGVNGHEAIKSFLKIPYDVMAIGNHELYVSDVTLDVYKNFAPKLDERYLSSNAYLLSTNHNGTNVENIIGSRYRRRQVTSLGVLFDFKEHNANTTVHSVASMVAETWFQELMRQPTDIFIIAGHMSVLGGEWNIISDAIRKHHPNTPIAVLGGHTHTRYCRQLDSNAMALESGRFMETIGWMSISLNEASAAATFSRRYLDANRRTYMYHTNTTGDTFDNAAGLEIDKFNRQLSADWNLDKVHGCSNQVLIKGWTRASRPYVFIANEGMIRYDIYRGLFTWNDQLTVLPFKEGYRYIVVPWSIARNIEKKLYEYPPDHLDVPSLLEEEFGATIDAPRLDAVQQPLLAPPLSISPGYITLDQCEGYGDDTEHLRIPRQKNPLYYSNKPVYPIPDDHPVDVVVPDFLKTRVLEAINKLSTDRVYTLKDALSYGTVTSKEGKNLQLLSHKLSTISMHATIKSQKATLRKSVLHARSLLSSSDIKSSSELITKKFIETRAFQTSKAVSCFLSMSGEVDTGGIVREILDSGKTLYVPRMNGRAIDMLRVYGLDDLDALPAGKWGIREPEPMKDGVPRQDAMQSGDLDLIIMPGVAFDNKLARLGYGKGYYDRFVNTYVGKYGNSHTPRMIGVALDVQVVEPGSIPLEEHDRILDALLTPAYHFGRIDE